MNATERERWARNQRDLWSRMPWADLWKELDHYMTESEQLEILQDLVMDLDNGKDWLVGQLDRAFWESEVLSDEIGLDRNGVPKWAEDLGA